MKIAEILDKKVPFEVVKDNGSTYKSTAKIGDRLIGFEADHEDDEGTWEAVFYQTDLDGNSMKFHATGEGNELEVFSMVKASLLDFVQKQKPVKLYFSAAKTEKDTTRASLYDRLIKRFKLPGYTYERRQYETADKFYFTKQK